MSTTLTTPTTILFQRDPTPSLEAESIWQLPTLPQLPSVLRETPPPPLKLNLNGNYPHQPNYRLFQRDPIPTLEAKSEWQLPSLPQLLSFFEETPPPPLKLNLNGSYPHFFNCRLFLERPSWAYFIYIVSIYVSIHTESIV